MIRDMEATAVQSLDTPRSLRAQFGLHQADVAEKAQVSARTITEIDAGRDVAVRSVRRVAHVLRCTPGHLLDAMERERVLRRTSTLRGRAAEFKKGGR